MLARDAVTEGLGLVDLLPGWLTHIANMLMLAVGSRSQFLIICTIGLLEYFQHMTALFPQSKWSKRGQSWSPNIFHDISSEVIQYHFLNILLIIQISLVNMKDWPPRLLIPTGNWLNSAGEFWDVLYFSIVPQDCWNVRVFTHNLPFLTGYLPLGL